MCFLQQSFIHAVSASLIRAPDFKDAKNPTRLDLIQMASVVAEYDAEFVLKVCDFISAACHLLFLVLYLIKSYVPVHILKSEIFFFSYYLS